MGRDPKRRKSISRHPSDPDRSNSQPHMPFASSSMPPTFPTASATPTAQPQPSNASRRLTLLLEPTSIAAIARKLWTVRNRLSLHTGGNIPSAIELAIALRLYMERCDQERARLSMYHDARSRQRRNHHRSGSGGGQHSRTNSSDSLKSNDSSPPMLPPDAPSPRMLGRLLAISDATYSVYDHALLIRSLAKIGLPAPLATKAQAQKWSPGYILVHDVVNHALILSVRGSRDAGDLLTNLSSDCERFLHGRAHQGVVNSARFLHDKLRPLLALELARRRPRHGLVLVGHSLGAAAASALTMLLRYAHPPRNEPSWATARLTTARCYAFSPPPFLDARLARRSRTLPIVSIAYGLDVVPRLSAASLDRLLHKLSAYDFSPHVSSAVSRIVRSVTMPVLGQRDADALARRAAGLKVNANVLAGVSGSLAHFAESALEARSSAPPRHPRRPTRSSASLGGANPLWDTALNAMLTATKVIGHGVESNANRFAVRRQTATGLRETAGLSADEVDRILDEGLPEMYLAGDVWHVDRPFVRAHPNMQRGDWPMPSFVRRDPSFFADVEVSAWMIYDHDPRVLGNDLNRMIAQSRKLHTRHQRPTVPR